MCCKVIQTKIINALLATTLLASVVVGFEMLATDGYLWSAAQSHALGLLAFTILALVLAAAVLRLPMRFTKYAKYAFVGAALLSTIELLLMIGDTFLGAPNGTPQAAFTAYLLSDIAFVALLGIQPVILATGLTAALLVSRKVRPIETVRVSHQVEVPAAVS